jgi:hypothetical protein
MSAPIKWLEMAADFDLVLGALADIAFAEDLDEQGRRNKAKRYYEQMRKKYPIDVRDAVPPESGP